MPKGVLVFDGASQKLYACMLRLEVRCCEVCFSIETYGFDSGRIERVLQAFVELALFVWGCRVYVSSKNLT